MSIFEEMNIIDDNESLGSTIKLSDALNGVFMVVVDDASSYNIENVVTEIKKDYEEEEDSLEEQVEEENNHIIVDPKGIKELIEKIKTCENFDIVKRPKNRKFMQDELLNENDVMNIIKQLNVEDYSYTTKSKNKYHEGAELTVFVTDKMFQLEDRVLEGIEIYVKLEYTEAGFVCVISFHPAHKHEDNSYRD